MANIEDSAQIARNALLDLIGAPLPSSITVDGHPVEVSGEPLVGDQRMVRCRWATGSVALRLLVKSKPAALEIRGERGQCAWRNFEAFTTKAIEAGKPSVTLDFENMYFRPGESDRGSGENRKYGLLSRQIAGRSGLPETTPIPMGAYVFDSASWAEERHLILGRLLTLCVIKTHFQDRGKGVLIQNAPLFSIAAQPVPPDPVETRSSSGPTTLGDEEESDEQLAALNMIPGPMANICETLCTWLQYIQDEQPTEEAMALWVTGGKLSIRVRNGIRHLRNMKLIELEEGQLRLTEIGVAFLESGNPMIVYERLARRYKGFPETLLFFAEHPGTSERPGASIGELLPYLNKKLGFGWQTESQAHVRAAWLVGLGLLRVKGVRYMLTDAGRAELERYGKRTSQQETAEGPSVTSEDSSADSPALRAEERVRLDPGMVDVRDLVLPDDLVARCCAALNAGKHLLLIGPPGTAKSTLAQRLAEAATTTGVSNTPLLATASADWTTYDTIGGWTQRSNGALAFREGVVTRALREGSWLVLDEVNRADIDKCFGELFTALAGGTVTTSYTHEVRGEQVPVTIGPDAKVYLFGSWFRLIATMNVRDKSSLFRLSYAFLRRFAVITVPSLDDEDLKKLTEQQIAPERDGDRAICDLAYRAFCRRHGFGQFVELGPSMLLDVIAYARERGGAAVRAVAEGFEMLVFPQLEGLEAAHAKEADGRIAELFGADQVVVNRTRAAFRAGFPHLFSSHG